MVAQCATWCEVTCQQRYWRSGHELVGCRAAIGMLSTSHITLATTWVWLCGLCHVPPQAFAGLPTLHREKEYCAQKKPRYAIVVWSMIGRRFLLECGRQHYIHMHSNLTLTLDPHALSCISSHSNSRKSQTRKSSCALAAVPCIDLHELFRCNRRKAKLWRCKGGILGYRTLRYVSLGSAAQFLRGGDCMFPSL